MTATTAIDHAGAGVQATGEPVEPATADPGLDLVLVSEQAQAWRTRRDERLEHLFEERCDWIRAYGNREHLAVDSDELRLTYDQLDQRANQLARYLWMRGVSPGDRVALLFDQPAYSYVAMLAVLKIGAAYVPLDVSFPTDRMAYICQDARVSVVLTMSAVLDKVDDLGQVTGNGAEIVYLDQQAALIAEMNSQRLIAVDWRADREQLAYIIYTSGSTGKPKGVAIDHPSICNFVRVAAEMYGIKPQDRVYQGLTIAFDFSFEEIWVPWVSGATLVPKQAGRSMLGDDLHQFLTERRVTALCCVPTLLATLERDLPRLRFLLVSGEACPQDLVARWYRAGRRFLNVYGPTEATVTATWTEVRPDKPVTIGVPLPTYATVILDVDNPYRALPHGEVGEIGIAGIGLACGYLNRDDLTEKAFITDFLGIPGNQSGRIYRTGDLGRVNQDGEIEYLGRIDLQVKIRGYRIELTEIESVLLQVPGVAQAVVSTYQPNPETTELVGYYSLRGDTAHLDQSSVYAVLREQLPAYMVPAYLEQLDAIPMTPQDKADRKNLPAPRQRGQLAAGEHIAPTTEAERALASALAGVLGVAEVSVDSHFFDQLGANSLVMAQFTSRARKLAGMPPISMKDVYQSPTIRQLAAAGGGARAAVSPGAQVSTLPERVRASSLGYALTGVVQALLFVVAAYLSAQVLTKGFSWIAAATTIPMALERAAGLTVGSFAAASIVPVLAKWVLVGRWRPGTIRLWSAGYVRFWLVKTLIQNSPMVAFAGSPLFVYYLRALGARVGRGATIHSRTVPVVTDLISFGAGAVIRRDCSYAGYRAVNGVLQLGPVTVGRHAHIGESTVLDINTELGDDATLGHSSALHSGQSVPARQTWHGCPAVPTDTDYRTCPPVRYRATRTVLYSLAQLLLPLVAATAALGLGSLGLSRIPALHGLLLAGNLATGWTWYLLVAAVSLVLFVGGIGAGLIMVMVVPRLLNLFITPGKVYPLYGFHYILQQLIASLTNVQFFMDLFGDSAAVVHYLRALGYRLGKIVQTGSNFGAELRQDSPYLTSIGTETMVSDALSVVNADYSGSSFRMSPVHIGERNFFGNYVTFPAQAKVGDNVLLATKVMVPIDGPVRENVGLLGSPAFEIPRSVERDSNFDELKQPGVLERRLAAKNRHNLVTALIFLTIRWCQLFALLMAATLSLSLFARYQAWAVTVDLILSPLLLQAIAVLVERMARGFRRLSPQFCSIYDRYFWTHERLWKLLATPAFAGTPFRCLLWRMLGVRIGRRVFDDGCSIPEKTLVTIGDDAILNAGSIIQCHSLEDGAFKSGHTVLGAGVTLGPRTFVHYGVRIEDNAVIDTDSFLMKGEQVGAGTLWAGNPAVQTGTVTVAPAPLPANLEAALVTTAPVPNPIETPLTEPTTPDAETMLARINALEQALAELRTATRPDAGELLLAGDSTRSEK